MNKTKRKEQPYNARTCWITFSVLALLLLIPFRIVGYWVLTNVIYVSISIFLVVELILFVRRYSWRKRIVGLMLICVMLPIFHSLNNEVYEGCEVIESNILTEHLRCSRSCASNDFIVLRNTRYGIEKEHPIKSFFFIVSSLCIDVENGLR